MSWGMVAGAAATVVGGVLSGNAQKKAAQQASDSQERMAQKSIDEQQRQFDSLQKLLAPYREAGNGALSQQQLLLGMGGADAQQKAIASIQNGPQFQALAQQGENAILQNASATGGLRGGNVQGALAQFRPNLLASLINDQYAKLGGLAASGQNAAAMQGSAGMNMANQIGNQYGQLGAVQAGNALAQGKASASNWQLLPQVVGGIYGAGGFGGAGAASSVGNTMPLSSTPQASMAPGAASAFGNFSLPGSGL